MPQAIRVIDRAADLADVATPFTDGGFLRWNNSTGKFETAQVSHAGLADLNGDHHNLYLRTDGMRAMTGALELNPASSAVAVRVKKAGDVTAFIDTDGGFWTFPAETSYRIFNVAPKTAGYATFSVDGTGQLFWGSGSSPADVTLYRDQASRLRVGGHFWVDNTLTTGRINSTATSASLSSLTPVLQVGGMAGFGAVEAPNTHTLVLYGYNYENHPILMVSAKGFESGPFGAWDASATARLTVLADGHVGINTTSPSSPLDVVGPAAGNTQIGRFRNPNLAVGSSNWVLVGKSGSVGEGATFGYLYGATSAGQFAFMGVTGDPVSAHGLGLLVRKGGKVLMGTKTAIGHLTVGKPTGGIYDSTTISGFFGNPTGGDNVYFIGNTLNGCYGAQADNLELWVNYRGYAGGTTHTRSFVVGDGKGDIIARFDGDTKRVSVSGNLRVDNTLATGSLNVDDTLVTGRIYSTATSAATSSLIPAFQASGFAGFGAVIAHNLETLVLYGYRSGRSPILMVSAKDYTPDPLAPWNAAATAWLTVLADGTVGIGTNQPTAKLDVIDGCIRARNGSNVFPTSGVGVELFMTNGDGHIVSWDRDTNTGRPLYFYASSYTFINGAIRCDSGFNVGGNAGFSGTIPAGRDIYVSGGIIVGHS